MDQAPREPSRQRTRWAAIGAAVAVSIGAGGIGLAGASNSSTKAVFVPIEPCRLADTRPSQPVSGRKAPLGTNDAHTYNLNEANGQCSALPSATGLSLNVTPVGPTVDTYLSLVPGRMVPPTNGYYDDSSNLNPSPSQPPTPNAVEVALDDQGRFSIYNAYGSVNVVIDVVGYYSDHHHDERYYTKGDVDTRIGSKVDTGDVYLKGETDPQYATAPRGWNQGWFQIPLGAFRPAPGDYYDGDGNRLFDGQIDYPRWDFGATGFWRLNTPESDSACILAPVEAPSGSTIESVELTYYRHTDLSTTTTGAPGNPDVASILIASHDAPDGPIPPYPGSLNAHFIAEFEPAETGDNNLATTMIDNDTAFIVSAGLTVSPITYERSSPTMEICAYRDLTVANIKVYFTPASGS